MHGAKYILALTLAMAGASALAYNNGYENHYPADVAGYTGYGNDDVMLAKLFPNAALNQVFAQCKAISTIDLADQSVPAIGNASFAYCGVPKLTIPSCVHSVGYISFGGCSNLTEVSCDSWNWADGTENLEDKEPFRDCFKLKTLRVSGDAAEPPTSFSVTNTFAELTTVYCPATKTNLWVAAYPTLDIIGVSTVINLLNGTVTDAFPAGSQEEAEAFVAENVVVVLTDEDIAAGLDVKYVRAVVAPVDGGQGYVAYVDVNPAEVPVPVIGSHAGPPMTVDQDDSGVAVGVCVSNAVQGLWYGCEVKDSLADPAFANDLDSFVLAQSGGDCEVPCTRRVSESAFYRVKVKASKPTE